ncbi:MAG: PEP-CTERM sorting domain-containing protein [Methylococcales bacterium]
MKLDGNTVCNLGPCGALGAGNLPGSVNSSGFDFGTGLGSIMFTISGAGSHSAGFYVDHEIDEAINTFFNEYGSVQGSPVAGQSWEIDEPGFVFGDIFSNFTNGTLDNSNGVPAGSPDDVAMSLAWGFLLNPGEVATLNFLIAQIPPVSGFYLTQTDPDSQESIYFYSNLTISGGSGAVPEPGILFLFGIGLLGWRVIRM